MHRFNGTRTVLTLALTGLALASCGGGEPGNAGPLAGDYTGTLVTTDMASVTFTNSMGASQTANGTTTSNATAELVVEGSRATGTDLIASFNGNACVMSFTRNGSAATQVGSATCISNERDQFTFMGTMSDRMPSDSTVTITGATLTLSGTTLTFTATGTVSVTQVDDSMNTTRVMGTLAYSFSGTLR